ncbi:MAG: protein kinase [Gemmatimonadota bacterium]|nr:protein kinase [Gemmatimonadota bacterium]
MSATLDRLKAALAAANAGYRVDREVGAGGMATVFLADDVKHNRKVAIKVLKEDLAASVGGARFLREIQIAAQLQHPNILPLLDSGDADGLLYYVMPYVDGQSLRQRLAHERELPIGEAVRLLVEIVDALAHAHARGVVHRDIKPDNVMLSGRHALITDFGVARAVGEATGRNTVTSMGVALGTPTYMAPEQAVADPNVDQRADIYAVGVVAYELLAGRPPFNGATPQQVLAAHVTEKPDPVSRYRPGVAPALEGVIMRCLEKRAADRWQKCEDLLAALEPLATPSGGTSPTAARLEPVARATSMKWALIGAGVVAAAAIGWFALARRGGPEFSIGRSEALTTDVGLEIHPALSPDGKFVAYVGGNATTLRVFVRPVGGGRAIPLSDDTTAFEEQPRWSPDGTQLLFLTQQGAHIAQAFGGGGAARLVIPRRIGFLRTASWSPDGKEIVYSLGDSLFRVAVAGGTPRFVYKGGDLTACDWSRDGKWIACASGNSQYIGAGSQFGNVAPSALLLIPPDGGEAVSLTDTTALNHTPVWADDGRRLLFISDRDGPRDIYEMEISSDGKPAAPPARLTTGLNAHSVTVSADADRVAYAVYLPRSNVWSLPIPASGPINADAATRVTTGNQVVEGIAVSDDGKWLIYDSSISGNADIWRVPVAGGTPQRLTGEPFGEYSPDLSPDGTRLAYHAFRTPGLRQVEVRPVDGGPVERMTPAQHQQSNPLWSPDGTAIAYFILDFPFAGWVIRQTESGVWGAPVKQCECAIMGWLSATSLVTGHIALSPIGPVVRLAERDVVSGTERVIRDSPIGPDMPQGGTLSPDSRVIFYKTSPPSGQPTIWMAPAAGGAPRLLVRFTNPDRPSYRASVVATRTHLFFTIDERQGDIAVAALTRSR